MLKLWCNLNVRLCALIKCISHPQLRYTIHFLALVLSITVSGTVSSSNLACAEESIQDLKARIKALETELAGRPKDPSAYPIPKSLTFCGDTIDLSKGDMQRRFELEVIKIIKNRYQVQLYIKRATSVFPEIEEIAEELDTCADLKFLAVVESALKPKVVSRAKATGWWQFMPATAKGFKLKVTTGLDERSDLRASTRAALTYLKRLYKRFNSWPLAMAGYNTGPNRLKRSSHKQKRGSFWDLDLYTEAERYSPRVLAMYHVLTHLKDYDFAKDLDDGWPQEPLVSYRLKLPKAKYQETTYITKTIKVKPAKSRGRKKRNRGRRAKTQTRKIKKKITKVNPKLNYNTVAIALDIPVRDLRRFNPHLKGEHLPLDVAFNFYLPPNRSHYLTKHFPAHSGQAVHKNKAARELKLNHSPSVKPSQAIILDRSEQSNSTAQAIKQLGGPLENTYLVKTGDQLWQIAARARLSISQLKKINKLGPLSVLKVGQRLKLKLD